MATIKKNYYILMLLTGRFCMVNQMIHILSISRSVLRKFDRL